MLNRNLLNHELKNVFLDFHKFREEDFNISLRVVQQGHTVVTHGGMPAGSLKAFFAVEGVVHHFPTVPGEPFVLEVHEEGGVAVAVTHPEHHVVIERVPMVSSLLQAKDGGFTFADGELELLRFFLVLVDEGDHGAIHGLHFAFFTVAAGVIGSTVAKVKICGTISF